MIQITPYLSPSRVLELKSSTHKEAIQEMVETLQDGADVVQKGKFFDAVWKREQVMSTGVGEGIALPHARSSEVLKLFLAVGVSRKGIDFGAPDRKPAQLMVLIGAPERQTADYLKILARVLALLVQPENRERILAARTPAETVQILADLDASNK